MAVSEIIIWCSWNKQADEAGGGGRGGARDNMVPGVGKDLF